MVKMQTAATDQDLMEITNETQKHELAFEWHQLAKYDHHQDEYDRTSEAHSAICRTMTQNSLVGESTDLLHGEFVHYDVISEVVTEELFYKFIEFYAFNDEYFCRKALAVEHRLLTRLSENSNINLPTEQNERYNNIDGAIRNIIDRQIVSQLLILTNQAGESKLAEKRSYTPSIATQVERFVNNYIRAETYHDMVRDSLEHYEPTLGTKPSSTVITLI